MDRGAEPRQGVGDIPLQGMTQKRIQPYDMVLVSVAQKQVINPRSQASGVRGHGATTGL